MYSGYSYFLSGKIGVSWYRKNGKRMILRFSADNLCLFFPNRIKLPCSIAYGKEDEDKDPIIDRCTHGNTPVPNRISAGARRAGRISKCEKRSTTQSK
jgi:hypothetical protein